MYNDPEKRDLGLAELKTKVNEEFEHMAGVAILCLPNVSLSRHSWVME